MAGGVGDEVEGFRKVLEELIDRVRAGLAISDLLAEGTDGDLVTEKLRPVARAGAIIESIDGRHDRVDAVVTADDATGRIVFAVNAAGTVDSLEVYLRPERFDGVAGGRLIVVNGPSGAGKSTLLHRGYLAAIAALARAGNHVALSAAGHPYDELVGAFDGVPVVAVGLTCELPVLLERERRTGRWAGIAAASLDAHDGWTYDLEFDTTNNPDPRALARIVLDRLAP